MFTDEDFQFCTDNMNRASASMESLIMALHDAQYQIKELNQTIDEDRSLIIKLTEIMNKKGTPA